MDARQPSNISYPIRNWFSPDDLMAKLKQNVEEANDALTNSDDSYMTDPNGLNLRDYQIKAINKATQAIIDGQQNVLIAMATGTGKTRTVLGLIYKMLETKRFKRILFLVDRTALGGQAMDTFKDVKLKELQTLCQIYDVKDIEDKTVDLETKVSVSTVQGLLKRTILAEKPELTSGAFDLIIVDEAHRGYILDKEMSEEEMLYDSQDDYLGKYKQVIEYFDAVKIGLTATPALHTTQIFGSPIFTYSYREAVIDGWLVDHDPPYIINTDFNTSPVTFKKGEQLGMFDPNTGELINGEVLQDELDFDVSDFNRKIVLPDHTQKVLKKISNYINPEGREKTLIFAVNDNHADNIVATLREIYSEWGVSNDAIVKITGKTASGSILIPLFVRDFLCIHPFNDGNGRMSRLLTILLLYKCGYSVGKYISIESKIEKTKDTYYSALANSSDGWPEDENDGKAFIKYTLGIILSAYRDLESRIELLGEKKKFPETVKKAIDSTIGKFTKQDIMDKCPNISDKTIINVLTNLVKDGYLERRGAGRATYYIRKS